MKKTITALALASVLAGGLPEGLQAHNLEGKLAVPPNEYKLPNLEGSNIVASMFLQDKFGRYAGIFANLDLDYDGKVDINVAVRSCFGKLIKYPFGVLDYEHHAIYLDNNMDGVFDERIDDHDEYYVTIPDCPVSIQNGGYRI